MRTHSKLALASLAATLLMAFAVSSASARNLSVSNTNIRVVWRELRFFDPGSGISVTCPVTLEGSFHYRTIVKLARTLIGYVTRAISGTAEPPCRGGTATIDQETLPCHLTYERFSGTLPNITRVGILLRGVSFKFTAVGIRCGLRERGGANENGSGEVTIDASGNATTLMANNTIRFARYSGGIFCPASGGFEGTGEVTLLGSTTTRIRVTLI